MEAFSLTNSFDVNYCNNFTWEDIEKKLITNNLFDIYFDKRYIELYTGNKKLDFFYYEENSDFFVFPYIKKNLPFYSKYYDIESVYGYSGILSNSKNKNFLERAWKNFEIDAKYKNIVCGFVRFNPFFENHKLIKNINFKVLKEKKIIFIDLQKKIEEIVKDFSSDNKNKINKIKKFNITVSDHYSEEDLNEFKLFYNNRMKEVKAKEMYFFKEDYFKKFLLLKNFFTLFKVKYENINIGMSLVIHYNKIAHYHLSACDKNYFKYAPNNILRYFAIKFFKEKKYNILNFGGGVTSEDDDTLLAFKSRFSKQYKYFYIGKFIFNQEIYNNETKNWETKNINKKDNYKNYLQKYRL